MKIGIAFSAGGHYIEAMKACAMVLDEPGNDIFFLTYSQPGRKYSERRCYYVAHPAHGNFFRRAGLFIKNFFDSFKVYRAEKPDLIISTGADVTLSIMIIAKLFGKKVIFVESGANVTKPSLTGRLIYPFADVFVIQWADLKRFYPKAIEGTVLL